MRNKAFLIWVLGFPFSAELIRVIGEWSPHYVEYSITVKGLSGLTMIIIWFVVGKLLYEKKP